MNPTVEAKLKRIPEGPGVYLYRDAEGQTIYVGKAKSLRNRVRTYFQQSRNLDERKDQMLDAIEDLEFIMTDTEGEALALENNLIKQHKPKYNILLRDDKTYPYIKLTVNEPYPRTMITRRVRKDGAAYFGPFFPAGLARKSLKLIERYFLIRNCNLQIDGKRPRPCLQYYIHRCLGPCVDGLTTFNQYQESVKDVKLFLEGRNNDLITRLQDRMAEASANEQYEVAAHYRDAIDTMETLAERRGRVVEIRTPQRGAKRELMELVQRNAQLSFLQRFRAAIPSASAISKDIEEALDLDKPPRRIECFDISNLQGSDVVASMVVWEDGRMKKSDYRHFIIRSLSGLPDDFQSMREVVTRRYKRIQDEAHSIPDLVLIDGGLGQLHPAHHRLDALNIVDQQLASIAKREEIIYIAGREDEPVILERRSPVLRLIQQIRDESHRFDITFHRDR